MAVTLADIKKLRDITGAGMMDVKKALEEANGDFEVAKDLLRVSLFLSRIFGGYGCK